MNVLFISNDPGLLQQDSSVFARMRSYADAIGSLHIITPSVLPHTRSEGALHVHGVPCTRLTRVRELGRKARALISTEHIQIVSAQDPFEQGLAAMRAVEGTEAKLHVQVHTDFLSPWFVRGGNFRSPKVPVPLLNRYRRRIADRVLPRAHGIRVVSSRISESLQKRYGARIVTPVVLPIAVTSELPGAVPLPHRAFTFTLLTVGRLEPEKRIEDSIAALGRIKDAYPAVGLVIVGEGSEKGRLQQLVHRLGLEERVLFSDGWRTDAWGLMRSCQAYIQTSAYEGYSRTLVEAALAEVPIITTDVGIVGEVFRGYEDVLSVPVADPAALAVHIKELVENVALRTALTMHAKASVEKHLASVDTSAQGIAANLALLI
jgi:glycosyltransferase involved in cell wall biosynthesis